MAGFHLEIVPRGGETVIFNGGARKGLDLKNNNTAISLKGGREYIKRGRAPLPAPLNETLHGNA